MFVLSRHHYPSFFVLFTPPSPSQVYTLSLHDALPILRSQLAATSRRLPFAECLPVVERLLAHTEDLDDKQIPMLIWWTLEEMVTRDGDAVLDFIETSGVWEYPLFEKHILSRLARRFASERGDAPSFTRLDPYDNWIDYASHPRRRRSEERRDWRAGV